MSWVGSSSIWPPAIRSFDIQVIETSRSYLGSNILMLFLSTSRFRSFASNVSEIYFWGFHGRLERCEGVSDKTDAVSNPSHHQHVFPSHAGLNIVVVVSCTSYPELECELSFFLGLFSNWFRGNQLYFLNLEIPRSSGIGMEWVEECDIGLGVVQPIRAMFRFDRGDYIWLRSCNYLKSEFAVTSWFVRSGLLPAQ